MIVTSVMKKLRCNKTIANIEATTGGVLQEKVFLENSKLTGKHLCQSLFFQTLTRVLFCEFCEISKNTFFTEHLWTTASINKKTEKVVKCKYSNTHKTPDIIKVFMPVRKKLSNTILPTKNSY